MAATADTVILALGTDTYTAGEGHDATSISLTAAQTQLLTKVSSASKSPVIVVMMTATPLDISQMMRDVKVGAVLSIGQPSVNMLGIGDLLFGLRSPAGRMIQTIYPAAYQSDISIFDFHMRPGQSKFPRPDCSLQPQSRCPRGTNPGVPWLDSGICARARLICIEICALQAVRIAFTMVWQWSHSELGCHSPPGTTPSHGIMVTKAQRCQSDQCSKCWRSAQDVRHRRSRWSRLWHP